MPLHYALPISVSPVGASYIIEGKVEDFVISPPANPMSEFEDHYAWVDLKDGFNKAGKDPTVLLDKVLLPDNNCQAFCRGITNGTASVVSDGSFNPSSTMGPVGTSGVIMAPSMNRKDQQHWIRGWNWVTGPAEAQSSYLIEASLQVLSPPSR